MSWETRKFNLITTYKQINPHIILINRPNRSKPTQSMKIPGYITYQSNITKELNDGSAILIKFHINYRLDDDYLTDILDIEVKTS